MKKSGVSLVVLVSCCIAICAAMLGCSSSGSSAHVVYRVEPLVKAINSRDYDNYQIVYYAEGKKDKNTENFSLLKHNNDILTRIDDEIHFSKDEGWTEDEVNLLAAGMYPGMESLDFVTKTVADKGDVYCIHVRFDDLRKTDNLQAMVDNDVLTMGDEEAGSKVDKAFSAGSIMNSTLFSGGHELLEEEVESLELHFDE